MSGRLTEEVVVRGVIGTLNAHRFDLPPEVLTELGELLKPFVDEDNIETLTLDHAIGCLCGDEPEPALAAHLLAVYLFHNDMVSPEDALAFENEWRDRLNELRRERGDDIDPDGPPLGAT